MTSGRRLGEYLARIDGVQLGTLLQVARSLARQAAPAVVEHGAAVRGYVPVFIDGTAIEVDGTLFEEARRGYGGTRQYWLHGVFIGSLWASGRLNPGGGDVAGGWREQLDSDVAPFLPEGAPVQYRRLPTRARRHGLRPLIVYLIRVVAKLVRNGRRWQLDCARNNFRLDWLYHASVQLE